MLIKELLELAMEKEYKDLEYLIMFLVFEKKVLTLNDDTSELDLYFLEKHKERMNKELHAFKKKLNIKSSKRVFEILSGGTVYYILAYSKKQAEYVAYENLIKIEKIEEKHASDLMYNGKVNLTLKELIKDKQTGILGGFDASNYQSLR